MNEQKYALPITSVAEIVKTVEVTRVPNMEHYYKGIINLRGSVVPVISLALRLGLQEMKSGENSRIIIVEKGNQKLGLTVDSVYSVARYSEDQVEKPESLSGTEQFISGIVHRDDEMILLLDLYKLIGF